jgi:hypothetical protein
MPPALRRAISPAARSAAGSAPDRASERLRSKEHQSPKGMSHSFLLIPGSITHVQGGSGVPPNVMAEGRERSERPAPAVC